MHKTRVWSIDEILLTLKTRIYGDKTISVPICLPQIPYNLACGSKLGIHYEKMTSEKQV
jgi:hypothetical protein